MSLYLVLRIMFLHQAVTSPLQYVSATAQLYFNEKRSAYHAGGLSASEGSSAALNLKA
jgi:hypothetical protein